MNSHEPRTLVLGDATLTVSPLMYGAAKSLYIKIGPVFQPYAFSGAEAENEVVKSAGPLLLAYVAGLVTEALFDDLVKAFGAKTVAKTVGKDGQERTFVLDSANSIDQVFGGDLGAIHEWLDFCVSTQYESILKKMRTAKGSNAKSADAAAQ